MTTESITLPKSAKGDTLSYRILFEAIAKAVPCAQVVMISSLPRGGTQIVQPAFCPEILLKTYNRELFTHDRLTWAAISKGEPIRGTDAFSASVYPTARFVTGHLDPADMHFSAAAPIHDPIFKGYPGAIHLYRRKGDPDFTNAELQTLAQLSDQLNRALEQMHTARDFVPNPLPLWSHQGAVRQLAIDAKGKQHLPLIGSPLEPRLMQQIAQHAQYRLAHHDPAEQVPADRLQLPDAKGDLWIFRANTFAAYPAFGDGPFVYFSHQPDCWEWNSVRPTDLQADTEFSRLIPSIQFMHDNFGRSPTLGEISSKAHLSPFHFHRRFTDLLGQTPKHYLLSCQIHKSKGMLVARKTELTDIAKECGFAHQSHFTSRFKQATGLTPTRWRNFAGDSDRSE